MEGSFRYHKQQKLSYLRFIVFHSNVCRESFLELAFASSVLKMLEKTIVQN